MKRSARFLWITFLTAGFLAAGASAAVSRLINFQGRLTDTAGTPITTAATIDFNLYAAVTGGPSLYFENRSVTPDSDGLYSLNIGESSSLGNVDFDQDLWLSVTVNGELLPGRYRLTSSPYALYTSSAGVANTAPWSGLTGVPAGFSDGVDDTTPAAGAVGTSQIADGSVAAADMGANSVGGTQIIDSTVTASDLAADAVTSAKILNDQIVNADVNSAAAIAYSKLNLSGGIVNADVNSSADIAASKINGGAFQNEAYSFPAGAVIGGSTITAAGNLQMPSGATISIGGNSGTFLPSGSIILTVAPSCPATFTEYTAARGFYLVGVPNSGTAAGTVGSAMANLANPGHSHSLSFTTQNNTTIALGASARVESLTTPTGAVLRGDVAPYIQVRLCTAP